MDSAAKDLLRFGRMTWARAGAALCALALLAGCAVEEEEDEASRGAAAVSLSRTASPTGRCFGAEPNRGDPCTVGTFDLLDGSVTAEACRDQAQAAIDALPEGIIRRQCFLLCRADPCPPATRVPIPACWQENGEDDANLVGGGIANCPS